MSPEHKKSFLERHGIIEIIYVKESTSSYKNKMFIDSYLYLMISDLSLYRMFSDLWRVETKKLDLKDSIYKL